MTAFVLSVFSWKLWTQRLTKNDKISFMNKVVIYIHGKGGNAKEAADYKPLFADSNVIGLDYTAQSPWEAKSEFPTLFDNACKGFQSVELIANSIGAYFAMLTLSDKSITKAYFISPIVDMEKLILDMMLWANVSENELREKKEIPTSFGETLSWDYLCYLREHPVIWNIPTYILYGEKDNLTSYETVSKFANKIKATLTVMQNGEHWFHTQKQIDFLKSWLRKFR